MASDFWSWKLWTAFCSAVMRTFYLFIILSCFSSQVWADDGGKDLTAEDVGVELRPNDQIILRPNPAPTHPASRQSDIYFKPTHVFHYGSQERRSAGEIRPVCSKISVTNDDMIDRNEDYPKIRVRSAKVQIERLVDRSHSSINALLDTGRSNGRAVSLPSSAWTVDEVSGPNITDKDTVLSFAKMAADAYVVEPGEKDWRKVGCGFNYTEDFGWQGNGIRGHVFADSENKTVVIGFKGTSPAVFDGSETTTNDKENDNLFFSCCCGEGGQYLWRQVCSCKTSTYTCNSTCVVEALKEKNRYYHSSIDLYRNVTELYPDADIWLSGHSLGGSVASLLGLTFGLPVVTFEAPGEALAASRLGLPTPPGYNDGLHQTRRLTGGHHFGHTADPIFMGLCNSASSYCTFAGYAMETVCHSGQECIYDTVEDLGWRVALGTHRIENVIKDVIEKYDEPPRCKPNPDCTDCFNWKYYESNGTETTTTAATTTVTSTITSTSTSMTHGTRTQTCKTPGWWGCLDESTTSTATSTSESSSTSTCKTPGWFGCKDSTTVSTTGTATTTAPPAITATATATTTTTTTAAASGSPPPGSDSSSSSATDTTSSTVTQTTEAPKPTESHCVRRNWYGKCEEWETGTKVFGLEPTSQFEHQEM